MLLRGQLGQTKPEGEDGEDDGGQPGQHEQEVAQLEQLAGDASLLGVGEDPADVEHGLGKIVDDEENQRESGESEHVGSDDECQVEDCVLDLRRHVFLLCLLEVKLGEDVEPVGDLNDEEELEEESHVVVRIAFPYGGYIEEILPEDEVPSPEQ